VDKPAGGDREAALVEDHKRHGLIDGDNPFNGFGEGRQLARLNETEELLAGDVRARPV
jgi:hypothetical protein